MLVLKFATTSPAFDGINGGVAEVQAVLREVAAAPLPSLMLRTPLRAACTIWSVVRRSWARNRLQKTTVASYTADATL